METKLPIMPVWALTGAEIAFVKANGICYVWEENGFKWMSWEPQVGAQAAGKLLFSPAEGEKFSGVIPENYHPSLVPTRVPDNAKRYLPWLMAA